MLNAAAASAPQRSAGAAPARPDRLAPKQDHGSEAAEAFRDKLQALGKDKAEGPRTLRKREMHKPDELALAAPPMEATTHHLARGQQDGRAVAEASVAPSPQPLGHHAEGAVADMGARSGDPASASLTARFAERLGLPSHTAGETHVQLDSSRYGVSNVTMSGRSEEGMSLLYDGGSADGNGRQHDEEALRQRLEARGLKVAGIHRKS
ncbi:hypothetical protein HNO88_002182 [Novosphingobium chloroacetimidivorans]|uniref:Uncharacterized protein n=1 Tax=Novosphingobium chloroacetimidivorans TaxID=1428314 RepID=A0A7W7KAC3_9SPHN|nr:hypothetical protein [Novosphingobium chloroacetimidivorans]MBB4858856.1 hypothetical protein [Novosphingobium chloroacetimidivorans]